MITLPTIDDRIGSQSVIEAEVRTNEPGSIIVKVHVKFCVSILLILSYY